MPSSKLDNEETYIFVKRAGRFSDPQEPASIFRVRGGYREMQITFYRGKELTVNEVFFDHPHIYQQIRIKKPQADRYRLPVEQQGGRS